MELLPVGLVLLVYFTTGESYSKYGRSCKDIGCLTNEVCVMETDPCSYYQRQNECGSYPTCKKNQKAGPPSCTNYVCPPTKVCKMDASTPKCVDDHSKVGHVGYDTSSLNGDGQQGGSLYPNVPRGETTPKPNVGYQPAAGQGYQGGQIGSGYPGQARPSYPQQGGGYPQQGGGYPQQGGGYPQQGGGYPQQGGGYPQQGGGYNPYPYSNQGGYNGYPQQGGYPQQPQYNYNNNRYGGSGQSSASGGILDSITNALKKYGTNILKDALVNSLKSKN